MLSVNDIFELEIKIFITMFIFSFEEWIQITGQNLQTLKKKSNQIFPLLYLDAAWKVHSNNYKQA